MSGQLVSPPGEPMPNARRFLDEEYGHRMRYQWDGTCCPAAEDPILKAELYRWFENKEYAEGARPSLLHQRRGRLPIR
jgi:hypothetical protein